MTNFNLKFFILTQKIYQYLFELTNVKQIKFIKINKKK